MSKSVLETFYEAFKKGDAKAMGACYHPEAEFNDPVFRHLNHEQVKAMWDMLIQRAKGNLKIDYHSVIIDDEMGQCTWEAWYPFSKTGNEVHNIIHASMQFRDGLIVRHTDHFNFWRWAGMALGTPGKLLGWTSFIKNKVRKTAMRSLEDHLSKK